MPSFATHHIFSATVARVSGETVARLSASYPVAYRWGSQGPDPMLFYHFPFNGAIPRAGQRLHEADPAIFMEALTHDAEQAHDIAALTYVLGVCTHYALDRVTDAFTAAQCDQIKLLAPQFSASARRQLVLSDLDAAMIAAYITDEQLSFKAYQLLDTGAAETTVAARTLAHAASKTLGTHIAPSAIYRSMQDMRRLYRLAHNGEKARGKMQKLETLLGKSGFASSLIRPGEPLRCDCANISHHAWDDHGKPRTDSFFDLFDAAVPLAVSLQRAVLRRYYGQQPLDLRFFPADFRGQAIRR